MRKPILAALSIAIVSLTATADSKTTSAGKALKKAEANILRGEKVLLKAAKQKSENKRVRGLRPAKRYFEFARRGTERAAQKLTRNLKLNKKIDLEMRARLQKTNLRATGHLVRILNTETAHYLKRGATSQARKANKQALALDAKNARARRLEKALAPANSRSGSSATGERVGRNSLATNRLLKRRTGSQTGKPTK